MKFIAAELMSYVTFALASVWSLFWVFFGLDFTDTFYHLNNAFYAEHISIMLPLTSGLLISISNIFGNHLIAYRLFNWLFIYAAYVVFYLIIRRAGVISKSSLWLLSGAVVLIPLASHNVFNGNNLTIFFMLMSFVSLYMFAEGRGQLWLVGLIVSVWLGVLSRFPNVVVVPIIIALAWMVCKNKTDYLKVFGSLAVSLLLYFVSSSVIFGGVDGYLSTLNESMSSAQSSEGSDHSIAILISEYLHTFKDIVSDIKYLSMLFLIPLFIIFFNNKKFLLMLAALFLILQFLFIKFRVAEHFVLNDFLAYFLIVYFYALICIVIFINCVMAIRKHDLRLLGWSVMPLMFSLCSAAGSDTGLCLLGGPLYAFFPFEYSIMIKSLRKCIKYEVWAVALSLCILSICAFLYCRVDTMPLGVVLLFAWFVVLWFFPLGKIESLNKYCNSVNVNNATIYGLIPLFAMCMILSVYQKIKGPTMHDKAIQFLTSEYNVPELTCIWSCPENVQYVNDVMNDYCNLKKNGEHIIFYGNQSELFCYLSKTGMITGVDFAMDDTERNVTAVSAVISDSVTLFLIPENPVRATYSISDYARLDSCMKTNGYRREDKGLYATYEKVIDK